MYGLQLSAHGLLVESGGVEPGVALQFFHRVAVLAVIAEQLQDHVFEVGGQASTVHFFKVGFDLTGQEKVVEVLLLAGFLEGENALYDNEDNDSHAEEVNLRAVIRFSFLDLRSHVSHRSSVGLEVVNALVAGETEISYFQVKLVVYENVLELEIAMDASEVVHVLEGINHLGHEEASGILAHGAHGLAEVEKEATGNVFHNDEDEVGNDTARGFNNLTSIAEVHHANDAAVVEVLKYRDFVLNGQNGVFVASKELLLEDLDGNLDLRIALLLRQVDFAGVALAETGKCK